MSLSISSSTASSRVTFSNLSAKSSTIDSLDSFPVLLSGEAVGVGRLPKWAWTLKDWTDLDEKLPRNSLWLDLLTNFNDGDED